MVKQTPKQTDALQKIHQEALLSFDRTYAPSRDERKQALEDRRFYSIPGAPWENQFGAQFKNKPKLEVNKIHLSVIRIINEYRNNRITVDFIPTDESGNDQMADACDGLYRADEHRSVADEAYDNAFEEAVGGGFGAYRLRAVYEDENDDEDERQRIAFEPIFDADSSVFFDADAYRQDKSDAVECWVLIPMTRTRYIEKYDDNPTSWHKDIQEFEFDWATPDIVFLAEYYKVEETRVEIRVFRTMDGEEERYTEEDFENDETLEDKLAGIGTQEVRQKKVTKKRVHKYLMSGSKIVEDCGYIAGRNIPIVPQYGKRWVVDSIERFMGHVRLAKDISRLKNMQISKLAEISSLSSVSKPILTPEQVAGHEDMWAEDSVKNYPYQLVNPTEDKDGVEQPLGPLQYTKPPEIPPALAALLQMTEQDMKDLLGSPETAEQIQPRVSGKAVELITNRLDMQTFIYISNAAKSRQRGGEIWISMASDIFVELGRKMKSRSPEGETSEIELMRPVQDPDSGETKYENDFRRAKIEVSVDVGPSFSSKRAATVTALTGVMGVTKDPETTQILGYMSMMNMEGENLSDVRAFYRKKLVRMGVLKPTEKELKELQVEQQNTPPDPNALYLKAAALNEEAKALEAKAKTLKITKEAEKTEAEIEKTRAETLETLSEIDAKEWDQVMKIQSALEGHGLVSGDQPTTQTVENF